MSVANPETLSEWRKYVSTLSETALYSKAKAANSQKFSDVLLAEGYKPSEITQVLQAFAKRFVDLGLYPPSGGSLVDFLTEMGCPDVQKLKLPEGVTFEWEPDQVDREAAEADLEEDWKA